MTATPSYYSRESATHIDGSPIFKSADDEASETSVAEIVMQRWNCELHSFGRLAPLDWYAERDGRLVGLLELKTRSHKSDRFNTVYLNVRKWLALTLGALGMGVPAVFIVRFIDDIRWISISAVSPEDVAIGGCLRIVKSRSDIEPVVEVPVDSMRTL